MSYLLKVGDVESFLEGGGELISSECLRLIG